MKPAFNQTDLITKYPKPMMKIFLQNASNLQLYCAEGEWGRLPAHARAFSSGKEALQLSWKQELANIQLLYSFANSAHNFTVPVRGTHHRDSNVVQHDHVDVAHA